MFTRINEVKDWWTQEAETTKRVIAALPEAKLTHKPHPKSRTAVELAWHIINAPRWFIGTMLKLPLKGDFETRWPKPPETMRDLMEAHESITAACRKALESQNDAWLGQTSDFLGKPLPNGVILSMMFSHEVHHRGQLSVYLRLVGAPVPGIYGPSADSDSASGTA